MHIRQQIREAVKTALAGLDLSVHTNRVIDLSELDLPAAVILTDDEISARTYKFGGLTRTIAVSVVVIASGDSSTLDDDLDTWAESIEALLVSVPPAKQFTLTATTLELQSDDEGAEWFGQLELQYEAIAFTN